MMLATMTITMMMLWMMNSPNAIPQNQGRTILPIEHVKMSVAMFHHVCILEGV